MFTGALLALAWANSPWSASYARLRDIELLFGPAAHPIRASFRLFINDFLMTLFFVSVGLAIKRHARPRPGEAPFRFPLAAAVVTAALPVLVLTLASRAVFGGQGWLIALGSDLGIVAAALTLARTGEGSGSRRFMLTFAAAVDAVAVAALFVFGSHVVSFTNILLMVAAGGAFSLAARARWLRGPAMAATGLLFWAAWSSAGFPPAIAGVFLALFASSRPDADERITAEAADALLDRYDDAVDDTNSDRCSSLAAGLSAVARRAEPEVDRWQRRLLPWLALVVMPLFGWVNAGVVLDRAGFSLLVVSASALGVALLLGKPAGFLATSWLLARRGGGHAMEDVPLREVFGLSLLSAAGGVMGVYAVVCAVPESAARDAAVVSVLLVSVAAALIGAAVARRLKFP